MLMDHVRAIRDGFLRHMEEWLVLVCGVICHVAGIYCYRLAGEWYEFTEYSNAEVCGFLFGTVFFSLSIPCIVWALKSIFWMKYPVEAILILYALLAVLSIVGFILSCFKFDGYVYFIWDESNALSPVLTVTSLISMSLCLLFAVICIIHFARTYATRSVRCT